VTTGVTSNQKFSLTFVEDASFFESTNYFIRYTLNDQTLDKVQLSKAETYAQLEMHYLDRVSFEPASLQTSNDDNGFCIPSCKQRFSGLAKF
jgi:hypothetical protein